MKLISKKSLIIYLSFIILNTFINDSYSNAKNIHDNGILSIMYHRFEENKYPSTNIKIEDFKKHLKLITDSGFKFISHEEFSNAIKENNFEKKLLLTIDDGFTSFYKEAWPILKKNKIPFILFVNTETVGANGYMDWKQIKEIANSKNGYVGNHSHSHDYLVDMSDKEIRRDLETSIEIFEQNLKYKSKFFAYPFGEYKKSYIEIVKNLGFEFAFGQHSGVMDKTKNHYELPRFPINEKYGEIKRFNSLLKTIPFPYKKIFPEEKYLTKEKNPPNVKILFFDEKLNLKNINCYSNEGDKWKKSKIEFLKDNEIKIVLTDKFTTERGRINCSLQENNGEWRWLGIQFVIADL